MKKIFIMAVVVMVFASCKTPPPPPTDDGNPKTNPEISVEIPELFSPNPDNANETMSIQIDVKHPVPIKDWTIAIQHHEAEENHGNDSQQKARQSRPFFEQSGKGTPPAAWSWNGRSASGEMVQSATDYKFVLTVNDSFANNAVYEGIISVDVIVRHEGGILRIVVPSIIFPPNSSDFKLLSQDEMQSNARVLALIAKALNKFDAYKIKVEGHANPTTPPNTAHRRTEEAGNRTIIGLKPLSEARAKAVVDYLVANNGIKRERLSYVGIGGARTVANYTDKNENWKNRRVEFILQK